MPPKSLLSFDCQSATNNYEFTRAKKPRLLEKSSETDSFWCNSGLGGFRHHRQQPRRLCEKGCERPLNVCLCDAIPRIPSLTLTRIVILHHPDERCYKIATFPVLKKCLGNCDVIVGRRLRYGDSKVLDSLYDVAAENPNSPSRAIYLFPGNDTSPLIEIKQRNSSADEDIDTRHCVLIVFYGTWKHAKEMLQASLLFLSKFASQVCLEYDDRIEGGTIHELDLTLRKETFSG